MICFVIEARGHILETRGRASAFVYYYRSGGIEDMNLFFEACLRQKAGAVSNVRLRLQETPVQCAVHT